MAKVVVVGGGWAGCAAALAAVKAGADVTLLEKTDLLLGCGLVAGIMRNNGRYSAAEEMIAMGAGELFHITDQSARHRNLDFPGHQHASIYDVTIIEPMIRLLLEAKGVTVKTEARIVEVVKEGNSIKSVMTDTEHEYSGDVFVDTTGTMGPMGNCTKYGNGCSMCILRCPSFGGRVSLSALAGVQEMKAKRKDGGFGAMSGSCKLDKSSLRPDIAEMLTKKGVVVIPLPPDQIKPEKLSKKICQQYALPEFAENLVLIDTGHAKMMTSFYPLEQLRQIPGFDRVHYTDPYGGTRGNSVRFLALAPRDNTMKVKGVDNLFCGGEKAGPFVGCTEAICTGTLGGHNAALYAMGKQPLELSTQTAVGDIIAFVNQRLQFGSGLYERYTFSGSVYFNRMREKGFYSTDSEIIRERVREAGVEGVFR